MAQDLTRGLCRAILSGAVLFTAASSADVALDAAEIRGLAASGFYLESADRARRVLTEAESRAPGSADEAEALDLNLEVLAGSGLQYSDDTRALVGRALQLKERLWGPEHPEFARTLVLVARLERMDLSDSARDMLERARSIHERTLAAGDPVLADTHYALFQLERYCGNDDRARGFLAKASSALGAMSELHDPPTFVRRLDLVGAADPERCEESLSALRRDIHLEFGPDHALTGIATLRLATCHLPHGRLDQARAGLEDALVILESALGSRNPIVGEARMTLGILSGDALDLHRAELHYRQGLDAYAGIAGEHSPLLRLPLLQFSAYLSMIGRADEALETATRAMSLGPAEVDVHCPAEVQRLAEYAIALRNRGDSAGAKALLEPAVEQMDPASVGDSVAHAGVLHHFGEVLHDLGDDGRAREFLERSLAMRVRVSGESDISNWVVLTDLGSVLARLGELDLADTHLQRAIRLLTPRPGMAQACISTVLRVVADVQTRRGDLDGARATLTRALAIAVAGFGGEGGRTELILRDLCVLEASIGGLSRDQTICAQALGVARRRYGPHHPGVARLLSAEAALSHADGDRKTALRLSIEAEQRSRAHFARSVSALSEREALSFGFARHTALDVALTILAADGPDGSGTDVRRVWSEVIRSRAMVLDEATSRRRALSGGDPEARRLFEELEMARGRLSRALRASVDVVDRGRSRAEIAVAVAGVDAAERKWRARQLVRGGGARTDTGMQEVLAALPRGAALVAYVRYRQMESSRPGGGALEYAALVAASASGPFEFIPLGDAAHIDAMIADWSRALGSEPTPGLGAAAESAYRRIATPLREAIWDPVRARLGSPSFVLVVPDGSLHRVAFGTLPAGRDRYLVETDAPTHLLSTERDVAALAAGAVPAGGLLTVGNPAFDAAPDAASGAAVGSDSSFRGPSRCSSLGSLDLQPLPNAIAEVEDVRRAWLSRRHARSAPGVVMLLGADATERAFKQSAHSSRIIHLATHAFVLPPECIEAAGGPAAAPDRGWLTLAGLAFAGANRPSPVDLSENDGILTTEEVASLDLTRTEWVVLSACESGQGPVVDGEGVFGFRRALQIAGVRTAIMSLWQVRDDAARDWMGRLYRARMDGASTVVAMRSAALGALESRRSRGLDGHPSRWGAFVAVGDWR